MKRDYLTLFGFAAMSVFVVFGYQNFDNNNTKAASLHVQSCKYTPDLQQLKDFVGRTPIVYSLENQQIWKGQSAGTFQKLGVLNERVVNFRVVEAGKIQTLAEPHPMEFTLSESKDGGENWMILANVSEQELGATVYDAIEFQNQIIVAVKRLNGDKTFLRIQSRSGTSSKWELQKELEVDQDSIAAFGKDSNGNMYLAYTQGNKIFVEKRTSGQSLAPMANYEFKAPWYILPSNFMGVGVDRNNNLRIFVNVGNTTAAKPASDTRTFLLSFPEKEKVTSIEVSSAGFPNLVSTHMAISEDGTISLNGIQKVSTNGVAETCLRVSYCD